VRLVGLACAMVLAGAGCKAPRPGPSGPEGTVLADYRELRQAMLSGDRELVWDHLSADSQAQQRASASKLGSGLSDRQLDWMAKVALGKVTQRADQRALIEGTRAVGAVVTGERAEVELRTADGKQLRKTALREGGRWKFDVSAAMVQE
jgi:hypothetical protein